MADWFALYTKSRNEKKVHAQLLARGIESYLPLQKTLKQWSDRKKWVEEPMIRSYVFVRITGREYFDVLNTPGAVRFIFFEGKAAVIPDWQIKAIQHILASGEDVEITDEHLEPGDKVLITRGPFRDIPGELIKFKGSRKVVLRIDHIGHSLLLTISPGNLKRIS
jgi:transcriptional antiterminator RfaH